MRLIVLFLALLALAGCDRQKPEAPQARRRRGGRRAGQGRRPKPYRATAPGDVFHDPDGGDIGLANSAAGRCWSICGRAGARRASRNCRRSTSWRTARDGQLGMIAVSQDMAPQGVGRRIPRRARHRPPRCVPRPRNGAASALGVQTMPTTVLYDRGQEVWRYIGDLDWTGAEAARLLAEANPAAVRS